MNDEKAVREQYASPDRLNTRISIHARYSVNKQGFGSWILSHYRLWPGMSVLELGCGTGDMWRGQGELIGGCGRFVLSDFSVGMLEQAQETLRGLDGIEYRVIDIRDIPFADRSFDAVMANMMLYHVPDRKKALREVRRVLKEDGTFYCATYGERGMMAYICGLFAEYGVHPPTGGAFTLQNGESQLRTVFPDIRRLLYRDALAVTDVEDMAEYIASLTGMSELRRLPKDVIRSVLRENMRDGVLHVPKEYGMFIVRGP